MSKDRVKLHLDEAERAIREALAGLDDPEAGVPICIENAKRSLADAEYYAADVEWEAGDDYDEIDGPEACEDSPVEGAGI